MSDGLVFQRRSLSLTDLAISGLTPSLITPFSVAAEPRQEKSGLGVTSAADIAARPGVSGLTGPAPMELCEGRFIPCTRKARGGRMQAFDYLPAVSVDEAVAALAAGGPGRARWVVARI